MPAKRKTSANEIYQIKITLLWTEIWRCLLVPSDLTLDLLHYVLQAAMGWENDHLHEFRVGQHSYGEPDIEDMMDEGEVQLNQVLRRVGSKVEYTYDFGDNWEHSIVLEKRLPIDPKLTYPLCIAGERACPPEDCGGVGGFFQLMEAIRNPDHPEHEEQLEWVGEDYDPEAFSIETVNRKFREGV